MSKVMWIAGILLLSAGVALGFMVFVSTASVEAMGIRLETAALLLVGGVLSLGLGSVISLLDTQRAPVVVEPREAQPMAPTVTSIPEFGRKASDVAAVATGTAAAGPRQADEVSANTRETIDALEEARQKIEQAFESKPAETEAEPEKMPEAEIASEAPVPAEDAAEEDEAADSLLYVVEERIIRLRPARILSDGTVEAETAEGWMRFENLEHLDEYLDAVEPVRS